MNNAPSESASAQYYNAFWRRFKATADRHPANIYRHQLIRGAIDRRAPNAECLVDFGCGTGALIKYLQASTGIRRFLGIDTSSEIVEFCKNTVPGAEFLQTDLQGKLAEPLIAAADIVVCSEVIEHLEQYKPLLQSAAQVVKPSGIFVLTTQGGKRRRHDIELLGHLRHFNLDELAEDVRNCGFVIEEKWQCGFPVLNLQKVLASLFFNRAKRELASEHEPSGLFRLACQIVGISLKFSTKYFGPQLVIVARQPARYKDHR